VQDLNRQTCYRGRRPRSHLSANTGQSVIDLSRNGAELLAEIGAAVPRGEPLGDLTDPRVATGDAHVCVSGRTKNDLFSQLKLTLSERFATVPRLQLNRDLLIPLRNALGNAYRHGNAKNPAKAISVGVVLSRNGALITVTDEGAGFDVAQTFRRFQQRKDYCTNRGVGFRNLHQAKSTVSYEDGGRTLLLCFRPPEVRETSGKDQPLQEPSTEQSTPHPSQEGNGPTGAAPLQGGAGRGFTVPMHAQNRKEAFHEADCSVGSRLPDGGAGRDPAATKDAFIGKNRQAPPVPKLLDPEWIRTCLTAELPEFSGGQARIEAGRVYAIRGPADDGCGNRYVLRVASQGGQTTTTRILTGRLHATEAAAQADFEIAKSLHAAATATPWLIPKPVARLGAEPRLVLYEFDPWLNLREYLTHRWDFHILRYAAVSLAALHRSSIALRGMETRPEVSGRGSTIGPADDTGAAQLWALAERAESNLASLPRGLGLLQRLRACAARIEELAALNRHRSRAPIHGALDWGCIHFGVDGRFYLFRFESYRLSDPGLDLGSFAADLLGFTLTNHNEDVYRTWRDAFLGKYNEEAEHPMSKDDLRFYIALALVERLGRAECRAKAVAGPLLGALEADLGRRETGGASDVPS
jgi:anti-sigma regulatory factor (Ser/Thr protein kinase)